MFVGAGQLSIGFHIDLKAEKPPSDIWVTTCSMKVSMKCPLRIFSQSIESAVTVVTRKTAVAVAVAVEIKTGAHSCPERGTDPWRPLC